MKARPADGPGEADARPIEVANEYALVRVRGVRTGNGTRLEIHAPRLGRAIRLCPLELEALTWQSHETFSGFLETPFGPEGPDDTEDVDSTEAER